MSDLKDILDRGVRSKFWKTIIAYAEREHGDTAVNQRIRAYYTTIARGDKAASDETATQILAAQSAIQRLLRWPDEEIKRLKDPEPEAQGQPRRAVTDPDVTAQSRRGSGL